MAQYSLISKMNYTGYVIRNIFCQNYLYTKRYMVQYRLFNIVCKVTYRVYLVFKSKSIESTVMLISNASIVSYYLHLKVLIIDFNPKQV
jgi:hypothetical protein